MDMCIAVYTRYLLHYITSTLDISEIAELADTRSLTFKF